MDIVHQLSAKNMETEPGPIDIPLFEKFFLPDQQEKKTYNLMIVLGIFGPRLPHAYMFYGICWY